MTLGAQCLLLGHNGNNQVEIQHGNSSNKKALDENQIHFIPWKITLCLMTTTLSFIKIHPTSY